MLDTLLLTNPTGNTPFWLGVFVFFVLLFNARNILAMSSQNKYFQKSIKKKWLISKIFIGISIFLVLTRIAEVPYFGMEVLILIFGLLSVFFTGKRVSKVFQDYKNRQKSVEREARKKLQG